MLNITAQQDSKTNISITSDSKALAVASKRGSSAMKIIAYLTTLFLPATFVSTLFSMPLWNWEVSTVSEAPSSHFWLYWAVAIPLTIVIMSVFGVYGWHQGRKNKRKAEKAREDLVAEKIKDVWMMRIYL
ncbi:hypothetical protein QBC38DRAFT_464136, partial [Podospora fimiseda]